jgi:hypothetical protein
MEQIPVRESTASLGAQGTRQFPSPTKRRGDSGTSLFWRSTEWWRGIVWTHEAERDIHEHGMRRLEVHLS